MLALNQILTARTGERVDRELEQEVTEFRRLVQQGQDPRTGRPFGNDIAAVFDLFLSRNDRGGDLLHLVDGLPIRASSSRIQEQGVLAEIEGPASVEQTTRGEVEVSGP